MNSGVDDVIDILRFALRDSIKEPDAFRWALLPLWADEVAVQHHPPLPADGVSKGIDFGKYELSFPDPGVPLTWTDNDVSVDGEKVVVQQTLTCTLPNGTDLRMPNTLVFVVEKRRIVSYDAYYDPEAVKPLMEYVASRAAEHPTDVTTP